MLEFPQTTTAAGALTQSIPLALSATTRGAIVYHYGVCLDAAANGIGIVTSHSRETLLGDGLPVTGCRIYAYNSSVATTGSKDSTIVVTAFKR